MFMVLLTYGNDAQSLSSWGICCMLAPLLRVLRCSVTPFIFQYDNTYKWRRVCASAATYPESALRCCVCVCVWS